MIQTTTLLEGCPGANMPHVHNVHVILLSIPGLPRIHPLCIGRRAQLNTAHKHQQLVHSMSFVSADLLQEYQLTAAGSNCNSAKATATLFQAMTLSPLGSKMPITICRTMTHALSAAP